jgi:hypothetical protein
LQRQFAVGILAYSPIRRGATLGIVIGLITVAIIFLMVTKPPLWG